ncbi:MULTISPECIES: ABC transporter ATP-binding protein [unclassified Blastococcus]
MTTPMLRVAELSKSYPSRSGPVRAIDSVTFDVAAGEFVSLVGPSGCGKTTLMNCISGLLRRTSGTVELAGRVVDGPPAEVGVVFQDYSRSLFPWMTCGKNIALPLKDAGLDRAARAARIQEVLGAVSLDGVTDLYPWQLSGGMQQRVAIARSLALRPKVLIMDEPFASVDAQTRAVLEDLVLEVWAGSGTTVLFVTHDIDEAVYLSDRVVVLSQGPSHVAREVAVPLPRPRHQVTTKELPEFGQLRGEIFELVMQSQRRGSLLGTEAAGAR